MQKSIVSKIFMNDRVTFFQINGESKYNFGFANQMVDLIGSVKETIEGIEKLSIPEMTRQMNPVNEVFMLKVYPDLREVTDKYITKH